MDLEKQTDVSRPIRVCAECHDDLILSRSGHHFCVNRFCKDGFDVGRDLRLKAIVRVPTKKKKRH
jgi:hypothetical protein